MFVACGRCLLLVARRFSLCLLVVCKLLFVGLLLLVVCVFLLVGVRLCSWVVVCCLLFVFLFFVFFFRFLFVYCCS